MDIKEFDNDFKYMQDVYKHRDHVARILWYVLNNISKRGQKHDLSKLFLPEKEMYKAVVTELSAAEYGSQEYKENLNKLGIALQHHYKENDHHPEHFKNGIRDMDILQFTEMLADWSAAIILNEGDIEKSLQINKERFSMSEDMVCLARNTLENFWQIFEEIS